MFMRLQIFYNLPGAKSVQPPSVLWFITDNCNMSCRHCSLFENKKRVNSGEVMHIARQLAASSAPLISLTGGEPLLVPEIKEIITLLKSKGKIVTMNSNGLLLNQYADFLTEVGLDSIYISIDGPDADTHNKIRNRPAFDKVIENIKMLQTARKGKKPFIGIRSVLMKDNLNRFEEIVDRFYDFADDFHFQPVYIQDNGPVPSEKDSLFNKNNVEEEEMVRSKLAQILNKYPKFRTSFYKTIPDFLFHPEKIEKKAIDYCMSKLFFSLIIYADGTAYVCDKSIGNLHDMTIKQIWNSEERMEFFKQLSAQGYCTHPCWCSSYMSGSRLPGLILRKVFF